MSRLGLVAGCIVAVGCGDPHRFIGDANGGGGDDDGIDANGQGSGSGDGSGSGNGSGSGSGNGSGEGSGSGSGSGSSGVITGGPCLSGHPGAAAFRITWLGSGGTAHVQYNVNGFPDHTDSAGAYGYTIPFTPSFVDPYLGDGGVQLDGSDFIDLQFSTVGVSSITTAMLSIRGRSYNTTAPGSFNWQTLYDVGETDDMFVSNSAPYQWYSADITSALQTNVSGLRLRIKSGPLSDALVVNQIELCLQAN